jgi:hypothetical protein
MQPREHFKVPVTLELIFGLLKVCYECSSFAKKILLLVKKQKF